MRRIAILSVGLLVVGVCLAGGAMAADSMSETSAEDRATAGIADGIVEFVASADDPEDAGEPVDGATGDAEDVTEDDNESGMAFGQEISSFAQSTGAETNGAVEQGMWEARMAGNGTPEAVENRTAELLERLAALHAERAEVREARLNGEINQTEFVTEMARINGELRGVASAAEGTGSVAEAVGADPEQARQIGQQARAETGPPTEIPGVGPDGEPGPPDWAPGGDDGEGPVIPPGQSDDDDDDAVDGDDEVVEDTKIVEDDEDLLEDDDGDDGDDDESGDDDDDGDDGEEDE